MIEKTSSRRNAPEGGFAPATATRTPTTASSASLCELCSRSLVLDDSRIGATRGTSSDGMTSALCLPVNKSTWPMPWCGGINFERTVTTPDLPELSVPAQEGCRFCAMLKKALLDRYKDRDWWSSPMLKISLEFRYQWGPDRTYLAGDGLGLALDSLRVTATHPDIPTLYNSGLNHLHFHIAANEGKCRDWLRIRRNPLDPEGPMSKRNIAWVRHQLDVSDKDLQCSGMRRMGRFVPKRLLDLGLASKDQPAILIDISESPLKPTVGGTNVRYACLSYCWGSSVPLRTTSHTLAKHKQGIPVDKLPQVFNDAIFVARKLGLRYLWIDALCIIQDSAADWEEQSGKMSLIFRYSYIIFGAAMSSGCDETFLPRREENSIHLDFRSSLNPDVSGHYSIFLLPEYHNDPLQADLRESIWNTRGWVWQEQKIARRILIFGPKMLHLRCHFQTRSEDGFEISHGNGPFLYEDFYNNEWADWMVHYSGRKFTHAFDKLAAVSGLARSLPFPNRDYLAGLWLDKNFHSNLRWVLVRSHVSFREMMDSLQDNENYCAPSRSWASRDHAIIIDALFRSRDPDFELIHHDLIPAKSDAMVRLNPGSSMTVRGKIVQMGRRPSDEALISKPKGKDELADWWELIEADGLIKCYLDWDPYLGYDGDCEGFLHLFVTNMLYSKDHVAGLILYPIGLETGMQFFRIGTFKADGMGARLWPKREVTIF